MKLISSQKWLISCILLFLSLPISASFNVKVQTMNCNADLVKNIWVGIYSNERRAYITPFFNPPPTGIMSVTLDDAYKGEKGLIACPSNVPNNQCATKINFGMQEYTLNQRTNFLGTCD